MLKLMLSAEELLSLLKKLDLEVTSTEVTRLYDVMEQHGYHIGYCDNTLYTVNTEKANIFHKKADTIELEICDKIDLDDLNDDMYDEYNFTDIVYAALEYLEEIKDENYKSYSNLDIKDEDSEHVKYIKETHKSIDILDIVYARFNSQVIKYTVAITTKGVTARYPFEDLKKASTFYNESIASVEAELPNAHSWLRQETPNNPGVSSCCNNIKALAFVVEETKEKAEVCMFSKFVDVA